MTVQELLALTKVTEYDFIDIKDTTPAIICMDGTRLSVQASEYTYCNPRENRGPYSSVEVGYPSRRIEKLMPWAEALDDPTETIYGYVPIEVVEEVVADCGGICVELTLLAKKGNMV